MRKLLVAALGMTAVALAVVRADEKPAAKPIKALLVIGGCCHEYNKQKHVLAKGVSARAHAEFTGMPSPGNGAQEPIAVTFTDGDSPVTKGLADWTTIKEELYNNRAGKPLDTARPLAGGKQTYKDKNGKEVTAESVVAWTNKY